MNKEIKFSLKNKTSDSHELKNSNKAIIKPLVISCLQMFQIIGLGNDSNKLDVRNKTMMKYIELKVIMIQIKNLLSLSPNSFSKTKTPITPYSLHGYV
jgi:hypothetical protein